MSDPDYSYKQGFEEGFEQGRKAEQGLARASLAPKGWPSRAKSHKVMLNHFHLSSFTDQACFDTAWRVCYDFLTNAIPQADHTCHDECERGECRLIRLLRAECEAAKHLAKVSPLQNDTEHWTNRRNEYRAARAARIAAEAAAFEEKP